MHIFVYKVFMPLVSKAWCGCWPEGRCIEPACRRREEVRAGWEVYILQGAEGKVIYPRDA